jgi:hypothetical protein
VLCGRAFLPILEHIMEERARKLLSEHTFHPILRLSHSRLAHATSKQRADRECTLKPANYAHFGPALHKTDRAAGFRAAGMTGWNGTGPARTLCIRDSL